MGFGNLFNRRQRPLPARMKSEVRRARRSLAEGKSFDVLLRELHDRRRSAVESIYVLSQLPGMDHGSAKRALLGSPAWAKESAAHDALMEEFIDVIEKEIAEGRLDATLSKGGDSG
jgi:hypothetical protein